MIGKYKNLSNFIKFINTSDVFYDYRDDKLNFLDKMSRFYMYIRQVVIKELDSKLVGQSQRIFQLKEASIISFTVNGKKISYNLLEWNPDYTDIDIIRSIELLMKFIYEYFNKENVVLFL